MADAANALTPMRAAVRDAKSAVAAWESYQPLTSREVIIEQAVTMARALRAVVAALDTKQEA